MVARALNRAQDGLRWLLLTTVLVGASQAQELPSAAPGRLIDLGTHQLHIDCRGSGANGAPTVVFEAGLGGAALEWLAVAEALGEVQRICVYDRAGAGWSEAGPPPRDASRIAAELRQLLEQANELPPYILVGHSFGGYSIQLFARRYPEVTAGLVLVDTSHPEQVERFAAPPIRANIAPRGRIQFLMPVKVPGGLSAKVEPTVAALMSTLKARQALIHELESFRASAHQVGAAPPLPQVPVLVLSRGLQQWADDERGNRKEALWRELQRELVPSSALALQIIAQRSGHHIHLDQPRLVAAAIAVVAAAAQPAPDIARQRDAFGRSLSRLMHYHHDAVVGNHPDQLALQIFPVTLTRAAPR